MEKKKVEDLAKSFSLSCKNLVEDKKLMRPFRTPSLTVVSLIVLGLVSITPDKCFWTK